MTERTVTAFLYDDWESNSESPEAIFASLEDTLQNGDANVVSAYRYYRSSQIQNNLTLYIGGILSFVFLLAVASFIYSRLYSELDAECRKLKGIVKIGLSRKELSRVLSRLIFLILCVPFVLALVYLWIGGVSDRTIYSGIHNSSCFGMYWGTDYLASCVVSLD